MILFAAHALVGENLDLEHNVRLTIDASKITSLELHAMQQEGDIVLDDHLFLMPALIDSHTHLALDARIPGHLFMMDDVESVQTIRALKSLNDDLHAGITGVRAMGDRYYLDIILRDTIKKGELKGPWIEASGIGMKGLHGHGYVGKGFSGIEEFRRQSRENLYRGADWLKLFITGGAPPHSGATPSFLHEDEIRCVIDEAHQVGKRVTAHCIGGQGLQYACSHGIDCLEHLYWVTEEDVDAINTSGVTVCFTPGVFMDDSRLPFCPPGHIDNVRRFREDVKKRLENLVASSPSFIIGSDAYHGRLWKEIEYMVELGMSRREAVKGITVYPGKISRQELTVGRIEEGCAADLIAVPGNPLDKPRVLEKVPFIMNKGEMIRELRL